MRYLTSLIVGLCLVGIAAFALLDARSRDSSLWAYRHDFDPYNRRITERYLQFSGTPGVLLLGAKTTRVDDRLDPRDLAEPWKVELKPYPFISENIAKTKSTKREGGPLRTTLGFHLRTHGEEGTDFFARYLFVSCRWMIAHLSTIIVAQFGLHWWLTHRAAGRRSMSDTIPASAAPPEAGSTSAP